MIKVNNRQVLQRRSCNVHSCPSKKRVKRFNNLITDNSALNSAKFYMKEVVCAKSMIYNFNYHKINFEYSKRIFELKLRFVCPCCFGLFYS